MILETKDLTKAYGKTQILNGINIHIEKGEIYGLVGNNGAGKTTLMKMLLGLTNPTSGEYRLLDTDNKDMARTKIGSIIEAPAVYKNMTAKENLIYYSTLKGVNKKVDVDELLEKVGLKDTNKKKAGKFSLGMKQRLSIAIALLNDPEFLILDEPINGLDPTGIAEIRAVLQRLKDEGKTILISSHIIGELTKLATNYGIVSGGRIVEEISAKDLKDKVGLDNIEDYFLKKMNMAC